MSQKAVEGKVNTLMVFTLLLLLGGGMVFSGMQVNHPSLIKCALTIIHCEAVKLYWRKITTGHTSHAGHSF